MRTERTDGAGISADREGSVKSHMTAEREAAE